MSSSCCDVPQLDKQPVLEEQSQQTTLYLQIQGMNCGNCANRVRNSLLSTFGVTSVTIEQFDGLAEVRFNPNLTSPEKLIKAVQSAGGDGVHEYLAQVISLD